MSRSSELNPAPAFDCWELEEKLNHVRRILGQPAPSEAVPLRHRNRGAQTAWVLTKAAVAAGVCGGVLAAWSVVAGRGDLIAPAVVAAVIAHLAWLASCSSTRLTVKADL